MHFPERVYGIENEFGVARIFPNGTFASVDKEQGYQRLDVILKRIPRSIFIFGTGQKRLWHSNGSCTYIDTGEHPEHATPECMSIRDVVKYNKAGERLVAEVFDDPISDNGKLLLFKNNVGVDEKGNIFGEFGCHENYMLYTNDSINPQKGFMLIPFLITRQIFDGAGWWTRNNEFCFSQRALSIQREFDAITINARPIINTRRSLDTGTRWRLHLIVGDSNILEFAMYLKIGTTALMLHLIEAEKIPRLKSENAVNAINAISLHYDPFEPLIDIENNGKKSAFDIQTIYLQAAQKELMHGSFASEKTEAELKHIGLCWEQALNAIYNRDIPWMIGRFDHVTKKYLCKQAMRYRKQENPRDIYSTLKDIDIFYHEIIVRKFQDRMNAAWPNRRLLNDKEIREAMSNPPTNTRAMCRGAYIDFLHDHPHHNTMATIEWASLKQTIETKEYVFNCPDPLEWNKEEFNLFMQTIKK